MRIKHRAVNCLSLESLIEERGNLEELLLPIDSALPSHPSLTLSDDELKRIKNGLKVSRQDLPNSQIIRLYDIENTFIGIGRLSSDKQLTARRLMRTN